MGLSTFEVWKRINPPEDAIVMEGEALEALQKVLLGMLRDVLAICDEHGLRITLSGGSCLGTIRHEGFIPWDDDIDINITRGDLTRFIEVIDRDYADKYAMQEIQKDDDFELGSARLRLKGTTLRGRDDPEQGENGVYIDFFVLEEVPENSILRALHGFVSLALGFAYSCARFAQHGNEYLALASESQEATEVFKKKILLGKLFSFRSANSWCRTWDKWNSRIKNSASTYLSIPAGRKHYFGELYRREDFFPVSYGEFEGLTVPLPANPPVYMEALYGSDYLQLPPEDEREAHIVLQFDLGDYDPRNADL